MTEIAIRRPAEVALAGDETDVDSWIAVVEQVSKLAGMICDTEFVPKNYRGNAPATAAAILAGRELGLPPMTALRHVQLVEGSPSLSAEYKRARVLSAGHEFDIVKITTSECTVSGRRRGSHKPPTEITFTIADARTARLVKDRGAWTTRPRRMLFARAGTELCDFLFADVTNGLPTTELLEEDDDGVSGYDEQSAAAARPSGRVTAGEIIAGRAASEAVSNRLAAPQNASPAVRQAVPAPAPADQSGPPPGPAGEAPERPPAMATGGQIGYIEAAFEAIGYDLNNPDDEQHLLYAAAELAGLSDISTLGQLDQDQAARVHKWLSKCKDASQMKELLETGEVPG